MRRASLLAALLIAAQTNANAQRGTAAPDSIPLTDIEIDIPIYVALANERFLLVSGPSQYLGRVDLHTGTATRLARPGEGPGEYRAIGAVFGCADAAGWVDRNLRRIVWLSPETGQYLKQLALPPEVATLGTPVSASCGAGAVWFALESRNPGRASTVIDTVRIFRAHATESGVQHVTTALGSVRHLRVEGSRSASLRAPWTAHPELNPIDATQLALVYRRADSVRVLSTRSERGASYALRGTGVRVDAAVRGSVLDSLRMILETEMTALRMDEAIRETFRSLYTPMLAQLPLPRVSPVVNRAWADVGADNRFVVLENGAPGAGESWVLRTRRP